MLLHRLNLFILSSQQFIQSYQLVIDDADSVLIISDHVFVIPKLHYCNLEFLAFLFVLIDFPLPILKHLTAFSDLIFEIRSLGLESDCYLTNLSINHTFSLTLHQASQIFKLLCFTLFWCLIPVFPFVDLLREFNILVLFRLVLLLQRKVSFINFFL